MAAAKRTIHPNSATYPSDCTGYVACNSPGGANNWNKDACAMLQSEETIALNLKNNFVIGAVNDFNGFFGVNSDNPFSVTGYTVAGAAAASPIQNWGDVPGVLHAKCTDGSVLNPDGALMPAPRP